MWGRKKAERPLREQVVQACERIRRQLEILSQPSYGASRGGLPVKAALQTELAALEQALAEMDCEEEQARQ